MIQRLQSVLLLFAAILALATLFAPVWQFASGDSQEVIFGTYSVLQGAGDADTVAFYSHPEGAHLVLHTAFVVLDVLSAAFLVFIIFGYNNRPRQVRQALWALVMLAISVLMLVLYTMKEPEFVLGGVGQGQAMWGFALPVVAIALTWYAARLINQDEKLVRSVDRLR